MPVDVLLGLQWGDEGKGKIVDLIADRYSTIIRFQGGPNAGHTIRIGERKFILHQIPSGIIRPDIVNVIGNGMVLDPISLRKEIETLEREGVEVRDRLYVSSSAHIIQPSHRLLDAVNENADSETKVGSTLKGIGPTYQDKTGRFGMRVGDILRRDFDSIYARKRERHLLQLQALGIDEMPDDGEWLAAVEYMRGLKITDTITMLQERLADGEQMLAEGAQGTLLDIDYGTYPYVTSSHTVTTSACIGAGISHKQLRKVYGICKAYTTRVGEGPFPTELHGGVGEHLRRRGQEFGSTTGRPRRCGWLDLVALRYAIALNGVDELVITKMDVLNELESIPACINYSIRGEDDSVTFADLGMGHDILCQYQSMPGWKQELSAYEGFEEMPKQAKNYIYFIEEQTGVPVTMISVGAERNQTVLAPAEL